jgi:hypothetical protein
MIWDGILESATADATYFMSEIEKALLLSRALPQSEK